MPTEMSPSAALVVRPPVTSPTSVAPLLSLTVAEPATVPASTRPAPMISTSPVERARRTSPWSVLSQADVVVVGLEDGAGRLVDLDVAERGLERDVPEAPFAEEAAHGRGAPDIRSGGSSTLTSTSRARSSPVRPRPGRWRRHAVLTNWSTSDPGRP
ncbi:hypothetical protein ACIRD9_13955 [Streptomyces violaceus]|uniref:hypothetical protein n=1 Tax=Streptomyces violaceus TaxID=1936 RepID=UPI003827963D